MTEEKNKTDLFEKLSKKRPQVRLEEVNKEKKDDLILIEQKRKVLKK